MGAGGAVTTPPRCVHLYSGIDPRVADADRLAGFLRALLPSDIDVRCDFLRYWTARTDDGADSVRDLPEKLARAKVMKPNERRSDRTPTGVEIDFERRFIGTGPDKPFGILYDGHRLAEAYVQLIPSGEINQDHCHIILTNQLCGTWDENDLRYHVRTSVYAVPSICSTAGLVEGPARPREFYLAKGVGVGTVELDREFDGRYLNHEDSRLEQVLEGYILQAVFYHVVGDPFCESRECRLFNAHWQEDLIYCQTRPGAGLCERHKDMTAQWVRC